MCQRRLHPMRPKPIFPSAKQSKRAPYHPVRAKWNEWEALSASPDMVGQIRGTTVRRPSPVGRRRIERSPTLRQRVQAIDALQSRSTGGAGAVACERISLGNYAGGGEKTLRRQPCVCYLRLVVDYSYVNGYMLDTPFHMEHLLDPAPQLCLGDRLFKVDIKDGYYHLRFRLMNSPLLAFRVGNSYFVPLALNCGLKPAPYLFTKFMRPFLRAIRSKEHTCFSYTSTPW